MSGIDKQELTRCRNTPPMTSILSRTSRIQTPSSPQAEDVRMPSTISLSSNIDSGVRVKAHAPTRGNRQARSGESPRPATSLATRGPTPTKKAFRSSGGKQGMTRSGLLPLTTELRHFQTDLRPLSSIRACRWLRVSRRRAERTSLFKLR